jgi:SAM-dependent methyltransferase
MSDNPMRRVTEKVMSDPGSWRSVRGEVLETFEALAPDWESRLGPAQLTSFAAGLRRVPPPATALDLACGTGLAADLVAGTFPEAVVVGADLSEQMVRTAVAKRHPHPVRFLVGDATALPFTDDVFGLISILNGFVIADELKRVLRAGGWLLIAYSAGEDTPIYASFADLERVLGSAGFVEIGHGRAGPGTWTTARIPAASDG